MPGLTISGNQRFSYTLNVIKYLKINLCQSNIATTWTLFIASSSKLFWKLEGITLHFSKPNILLH